MCEAWMKEIKARIVTMRKSNKDIKGRTLVLKAWRTQLVAMLGEIDRVIGGRKDEA
jgi:hypothetical protein